MILICEVAGSTETQYTFYYRIKENINMKTFFY